MDCIVHGGHKELDMMVHIACLRGATPRPRSGAEAGRTPCLRGGSQEELPHVRGQRQRPGRDPHVRGVGQQLKGVTSCSKPGAGARKSNSMSKE